MQLGTETRLEMNAGWRETVNRGENMDNQEEDVEGIDEDTEKPSWNQSDRAGEKIPPWRIVAWNHDEPYQTRELAVHSTWRKRRKQETGMGLARQLGTRRKAKTANVHKRTVRIPATTTQRITGEGKAASSSSQNEERLRETVCDQDQEKVRVNRRLRKNKRKVVQFKQECLAILDSPSEEEASDEEVDLRRIEQHEEVRGGVLGIEGARELRVRETFREEVVKKSRWWEEGPDGGDWEEDFEGDEDEGPGSCQD